MKREKLDIIFEDKYIIAVNKPAGLFTISTDKEKYKTLFYQVFEYLKKKNKSNKVFIVHRLDKDTSGLVVFAKSESIKRNLQENWDKVIREYIAVVNGRVEKNKGIIESYLKETKTLLVYSTNDKVHGKLAITEYEMLESNKLYSLLRINIKTGRKNQIRVHLNDINHSIVGDKKYGKIKTKGINRLCLHANYLEFIHPVTKELLKLKTEIPKELLRLMEYKKI